MPENGFGSNLWKSMQAVKIDTDGTFRAPVRANGRDGIVFGADAVEKAGAQRTTPAPKARSGGVRRLLAHLIGRAGS